MPPLPVLAGSRVVRALEKAGFKVVRIRGSHHVLRHPDGRGTSVPVHGNQDVRVGTLRSILRDCGLTADEFLDLLDLRPTPGLQDDPYLSNTARTRFSVCKENKSSC